MSTPDASDDAQQLADKLIEKYPAKTRPSGVYIIYDSNTNEPLYVGESKNVYQRLFDHHMKLQSGSKTVREHVVSDDDLNRETQQGAMWQWTEWAWIEVPGSRSKRKLVEQIVENELRPRYASD